MILEMFFFLYSFDSMNTNKNRNILFDTILHTGKCLLQRSKDVRTEVFELIILDIIRFKITIIFNYWIIINKYVFLIFNFVFLNKFTGIVLVYIYRTCCIRILIHYVFDDVPTFFFFLPYFEKFLFKWNSHLTIIIMWFNFNFNFIIYLYIRIITFLFIYSWTFFRMRLQLLY